jgi:ferredoxin
MRVTIAADICQGHGLCVEAVPSVFTMDDREHGTVSCSEVPPELESAVQQAELLCPEQAITIERS